MRQEEKKHYESATFGGGCFWCTEAIFQRLKGVVSVSSGYAGGSKEKPSYEEVCRGTTGHAEVVRIYSIQRSSHIAICLKYFLQRMIRRPLIDRETTSERNTARRFCMKTRHRKKRQKRSSRK